MWKRFNISNDSREVDGQPVQIVRVEGYLDSSTFPQLQDRLSELISEKNYRFVIDVEELNYISSAGLGVLMGMLQEVREHEGDLKMANMSTKIRNVFDMLGFSRLLRIYDSVDQAVEAFKEELEAPKATEEAPEDSY